MNKGLCLDCDICVGALCSSRCEGGGPSKNGGTNHSVLEVTIEVVSWQEGVIPAILQTMQRFLAICGRQPELSAAELVAVASLRGFTCTPYTRSTVLLEGLRDPVELMSVLGGTVKIAELVSVMGVEDLQAPRVVSTCMGAMTAAGKAVFGFTVTDAKPKVRRAAQDLAVRIKQELQKSGRSARYVRDPRGELSSVVVEKQILAHGGAEFILAQSGTELTLARTVVVQPFEKFSGRDYGRPGRNARAGMLPPKLARIMVHLSRVASSEALLDPFCGSGTILQEAALLGIRNLVGSDSSERAAEETQQNLAWMAQTAGVHSAARVLVSGVRRLAGQLDTPVHAVVTEPFLGPPLAGNESLEKIRTIQRQLQKLYEDAFDVFLDVLASGGRVVFIQPVFYHKGERLFLMDLDVLLLKGFRIVQPLPSTFVPMYKKDLTFRHTLLYHRPAQRLGREILILEKK